MKEYQLVYLDRNGNVLTTKTIECLSIEEARRTAHQISLNSTIDDLNTIVVLDNDERRLNKITEILKFFVKDTRGANPWMDADNEWIENNKEFLLKD